MVDFLSPSDTLSTAEIQAANPQGVPQAVNMPGSTPYTIQGATLGGNSSGGTVTNSTGASAVPNQVVTNPLGNSGTITPQQPATAAASSSVSPGSIADYFARAVIIILGFIFVAEGLRMLGITKTGPVQMVRNAAP